IPCLSVSVLSLRPRSLRYAATAPHVRPSTLHPLTGTVSQQFGPRPRLPQPLPAPQPLPRLLRLRQRRPRLQRLPQSLARLASFPHKNCFHPSPSDELRTDRGTSPNLPTKNPLNQRTLETLTAAGVRQYSPDANARSMPMSRHVRDSTLTASTTRQSDS